MQIRFILCASGISSNTISLCSTSLKIWVFFPSKKYLPISPFLIIFSSLFSLLWAGGRVHYFLYFSHFLLLLYLSLYSSSSSYFSPSSYGREGGYTTLNIFPFSLLPPPPPKPPLATEVGIGSAASLKKLSFCGRADPPRPDIHL